MFGCVLEDRHQQLIVESRNSYPLSIFAKKPCKRLVYKAFGVLRGTDFTLPPKYAIDIALIVH